MANVFYNARNGNTKGMRSLIRGETSDTVIRNLSDFLTAAGRDYQIQVRPSYNRTASGDFVAVPNQFNLVRPTDEVVVSRKPVTRSYDPLSLIDAADSVRGFVDAGWATPDCVFEAREGSVEILMLRLDADGLLTEEEFDLFMCLILPHGSGKVQGKLTGNRLWCENQVSALMSLEYDFAIGHRKRRNQDLGTVTKERFDLQVQVWQRVQDHIRDLSKRINTFSKTPVSWGDAQELTDKLLRIHGIDADDVSTQKKNQREAILAGFNMPDKGTFGRTAYDWINAVTYFTTHGQEGSKRDTLKRAYSNIDPNGTGFKLEERAMSLLAA